VDEVRKKLVSWKGK